METLKEKLTDLISAFVVACVSTGFLMWGWNTVAPHLNAPTFGYWEIFAMRMGLIQIKNIIKK